MQRRVAVFVVAAVLGSPPAAVAEAAPDAVSDAHSDTRSGGSTASWSPPVAGAAVREFRPAFNLYGAGGHAGIDYPAPSGTLVQAAGRGVVSFTGQVAGAVFVVVSHGHDLRTTYAPMGSVAVRRGSQVDAGDALGTAAGAGLDGHPAGLLHFGLRRGDTPLDPARLFDPVDLTRSVRLVPADDLDGFVLGSVQGERSRISRWVRGTASRLGALLGDRVVAPQLRASRSLVGAVRVAQGVADWATQGRCTSETDARASMARRSRGSHRHLVTVAGLNSSGQPSGPPGDAGSAASLDLPVAALGYEPGDTTAFSYAPGGGPYTAADTHVGPRVAAARLAALLANHARGHPGEIVDLVGHSQGGVVVEAFLKLHYREHPDEYPPIGVAVTLAAPHRGAPLASTARRVVANPIARALGDAASALSDTVPAPSSGSATDLDPGGAFVAELVATPLPDGVRMTTVAGVDDVLVPATRTRVDGADHVVVDPAGWNDHSGIVSDPRALAAVSLALAGQPPLCQGIAESIRARVEPHLVELLTP